MEGLDSLRTRMREWAVALLIAISLPSISSFAPLHLRVPRIGGDAALLRRKVQRHVRCGALTLTAGGKGGKVKVPYKEGAGGDGVPRTSLPVKVSPPAASAFRNKQLPLTMICGFSDHIDSYEDHRSWYPYEGVRKDTRSKDIS